MKCVEVKKLMNEVRNTKQEKEQSTDSRKVKIVLSNKRRKNEWKKDSK